ncbi:hypothetical protein K0M31_008723 [Melipona bicolor]|uniref:Uncharacterized protein n=1 Tax=Melipona bicolor TaxID=60889 RepID=A0AA40KK01_9HYME|nr:hypothetical protein K0M31_008723 [Melipona bicolor]
MFAVFCLLLLSSLGHCQDNDLPSRFEIESSINRTIEEVERQVREDSRLPRLTRQDIVKILENITSQDLNEFKDKEKFEQARNMYQRALMVVLPYSAEESAGNLKDLYTKPPMTKIIPDFLSESNKNEPEKGKMKKENNNAENSEALVTENLIANHHSYKIASKDFTTTMKNHYKNHRDTYSEVRTKMPLKDSLKMDSTPVRFTFNLENLQKGAFTTEKTTTRKYPIYDGSKSSDLEVVYSTSVTEEPVTKPASKEITIDLERFKVNQNVLTSSQWRYNAPPSTTVKPTVSSSKLEKTPFLPTINTQLEDRLTVSSTREPEIRMKDSNVAENFTLNSERATALFVTPMPTETSSKAKYSSTYSLNSTGFRQTLPTTAATITTTSMRPEVMDLLASIGLRPNNSNNVEDVYKRNKEILESEIKFPHLNSIHSLISGLISDRSNAVSIVNRNTFEKPGSEIKKGMENLAPDVQMLFKRFGLQTQNLVLQPTTTTTERTILNLNSYTNFKPLPTSSVKDQEMKEFLAKFGLGIDVNRREKSMKPSTEIPSLIEAVPSNMRGILENIGLITNSQKTNRAAIDSTKDRESTGTSKFHVFKPHEAVVNNEEQMSKINELLDTVKLVQQGKIDIQNVKKVANDLLRTTKTLKDGPDPLKLEEIIKSYNEDVRNEVKRQQDAEEKKETSTSTTTEQTTSSPIVTTELAETTLSVSTTTDPAVASSDQSKSATSTSTSTSTPNLMVLEESFGGTTKEPDTALPPRRKNGLYFLVDWNSFLEVGEDEKEKVNLRFAPKVGDRARFLPVTVP